LSDVLSDPLRELLRPNPLGIAYDVSIVLSCDAGISMSHEAGDDVNRRA